MARSFCVITLVTLHLADKSVSEYTNHRVLVGPQASIDALETAMSTGLTGSWELNLQKRAM